VAAAAPSPPPPFFACFWFDVGCVLGALLEWVGCVQENTAEHTLEKMGWVHKTSFRPFFSSSSTSPPRFSCSLFTPPPPPKKKAEALVRVNEESALSGAAGGAQVPVVQLVATQSALGRGSAVASKGRNSSKDDERNVERSLCLYSSMAGGGFLLFRPFSEKLRLLRRGARRSWPPLAPPIAATLRRSTQSVRIVVYYALRRSGGGGRGGAVQRQQIDLTCSFNSPPALLSLSWSVRSPSGDCLP